MKISCIYVITNLKNNKKYIGSTYDFNKRKSQHVRMLKNNKHHSIYLQNAFNKYGIEQFDFSILEECNLDNLIEREQYYLNNLKPEYNISIDASAPMLGRKHSKSTIEKFKGRMPWNLGIKRTDSEKQKMSDAKKNIWNNYSDDKKLELISLFKERTFGRKPFKGKHHTEENKKHLRELRKSKRKILCLNTGEIFEAQLDIAKKLNIKQGHISECLNGKREHVKGFKFQYV